MNKNENTINWYEIPTIDLSRAKKFYETIFAIDEMETMDVMGTAMALFPWEEGTGKVSGALIHNENYKPGKEGPVVYLNANPQMAVIEQRVEAAGGKVTVPKTAIGEHGFMCFFIDTQGNRIGLHSDN